MCWLYVPGPSASRKTALHLGPLVGHRHVSPRPLKPPNLQTSDPSTFHTVKMPYFTTSQEWFHQSSLLLQARPTTVRLPLPLLSATPLTPPTDTHNLQIHHRLPDLLCCSPPETQSPSPSFRHDRRRQYLRHYNLRNPSAVLTTHRSQSDTHAKDVRPRVRRLPEISDHKSG